MLSASVASSEGAAVDVPLPGTQARALRNAREMPIQVRYPTRRGALTVVTPALRSLRGPGGTCPCQAAATGRANLPPCSGYGSQGCGLEGLCTAPVHASSMHCAQHASNFTRVRVDQQALLRSYRLAKHLRKDPRCGSRSLAIAAKCS